MEKISLTPLAHNNKKLTEISSTTTTTTTMIESIKLGLELENMPKLVDNSVRANVSLRANFKKSNTCGSLFANCNCSEHPQAIIPLITETDCDKERPKLERHSKKNQSFSHPDTPVIFTEENRYPIVTSLDSPSRLRSSCHHDTVIHNGNRKVEIKHSKRSSSPNIGDYSQLNVDIHPEFKVQVTPKSPPIPKITPIPKSPTLPEKSTIRVRPTLKKGSKSFPSATCSPSYRAFEPIGVRIFSSSYSVDESEEVELSDKISDLLVTDLDASSASLSNTTSTVIEIHRQNSDKSSTNDSESFEKNSPVSQKKDITESAEKFFLESGILGPMGGVPSILKKSSKVKPILNDPQTKEHIRKTSLVLFGHHNVDIRKRSISESYAEHPIKNSPEFKALTLQDEIQQLKETIKNRDDEINKLKREIHKLKSVLQQQTSRNLKCECNLSSVQATSGTIIVNPLQTLKESNIISNSIDIFENETKSSITSTASLPVSSVHNHHQQQQQFNVVKKQGVSGESSLAGHSSDILIRKYEKDFKSKQQIKDAILDNDFLKHLDCVQVRELVESMYSRDVDIGEYVIRENEMNAQHFYVSAQGEFEIIVNGKVLGILPAGKAFGELAILYNCRRTASIRAIKPNSRLWVLDRRAFQQIMMYTGLQRIEQNVNFLRSVPLLKNLHNDVLSKIADVLELEFYPAGAYIIRQGARGDTFFLISQGTVKVTQRLPGSSVEEEIRTLERGDYFGEQSLIKEDKRTANIIAMTPGVECLTLDRESFNQHIGDLVEIKEKDYGDMDRIYSIRNHENKQLSIVERNGFEREFQNIELKDLTTLATIGVGGFGRVLLVKYTKENSLKIFALKQMKKVHILDTKQEEHVFNERKIMLSLSSPFICRMFRTFRDKKFIYLLLEACMGGEVWSILRNQGRFCETTVQFIIGCVLEAFEYLHSRGIIYRDLKPENLMLAANGYVKLVDFGFAKQIGYSSKTWTFCGTPEYVAPEIILNRGHDRAVDYWALGVLISELIVGAPPFTSSDPLKTYNIILKGIDAIEYPRFVSRSAISLIKKLCRDSPADRLGYQRNGIDDIRKHKWFQGFDWENLSNLTLKPPRISCVNGPLDLTNFDVYPNETELPPDETSGWDADF